MDNYKSLLNQEEILEYYIDCVVFETEVKTWVKVLKSLNFTYDEIVLKVTEEYDMSKWLIEQRVQEF